MLALACAMSPLPNHDGPQDRPVTSTCRLATCWAIRAPADRRFDETGYTIRAAPDGARTTTAIPDTPGFLRGCHVRVKEDQLSEFHREQSGGPPRLAAKSPRLCPVRSLLHVRQGHLRRLADCARSHSK